MTTEASQPLKVSLPVSAALAQAVYNEAYSLAPATALAATVTSITTSGNAVLTTSAAHGLANGEMIQLTGLSGTAGGLTNGFWFVTVVSTTTFSVSATPTGALVLNTGSSSTGTISVNPPAQYCLVKLNASGQADLMSAATDVPIGVLQNRPCVVALGAGQTAGPVAEIVVIGATKVRVGNTAVALSSTVPGSAFVGQAVAGFAGAAIVSGTFVSTAGASNGKSVAGQILAAGAPGDLTKAIVNTVSPLPIGA